MSEAFTKAFHLTKDFNKAVQDNDIEKVMKIFEQEEQPNINLEIITVAPILLAAQEGYWDMVACLFELGADLDVATTPYKATLLHECVINAPNNIMKSVADYANVNAQTSKGETALMFAIKKSKKDGFDYLINHQSIDIKKSDVNENTAIHYAAINNEQEMFITLVDKGADIFKKNKEGKTPLDLITDEAFRLSLPEQLEEISESKSKEVKKEQAKDINTVVPEVKKTGLSSIKKKLGN